MQHQVIENPLLSLQSPLNEKAKNTIRDLIEKEREKAKALPTDDPLDPKRRKRVEYTKDELLEQPDIIKNNLLAREDQIQQLSEDLAKKRIDRIYMTGCGDSIASMVAVRALWETLLGIPCEAVQALDFTYYYHHPLNENTLVITLSSSGSTPRTVEAMLLSQALGAFTLCLSNTENSPLMSESDHGILINAERKGWPTQSSTAAMALLYQLGIKYAFASNKKLKEAKTFENELFQIPSKIETIIQNSEPLIKNIAVQEARKPIYLYTGGGPAFASAMIGAAKIKECTPDHAISIPLEEFHHYNSQKKDDPLFIICPTGNSVSRAIDTAKEGRRWGGNIYSITPRNMSMIRELSDEVICIPDCSESLSPLLYTIPVQMFAYQVAMEKFHLARNQKTTGEVQSWETHQK